MIAVDTLVKILLVIAVVGFVTYPFFRASRGTNENVEELSGEAEDLYGRKESTYSALKELEFDFKTGKLSQTDFEELDAKYRSEALVILEAIDLYESEVAEAVAERAKKRERAPKSQPSVRARRPRPSAAPARARAARAVALADPEACLCGFVNIEGARFCSACGESLEGQTDGLAPGNGERPLCRTCGTEMEAGHRFCRDCGAQAHA